MKSTSYIAGFIFIIMIMNLYSVYGQIPVAYFPFNGNANDSSSNSLHGTVVGAQLTCDRFGQANNAYSFDGNDYIQISNNSKLLFGSSAFSLTAWIKFCNSQAEYAGIIAKEPTTIFYPGYQLTIASQNKLTTQIGDSSGYGIERRGHTRLDDGEWHFVVLNVKPLSSTQEIVQLYVDGVLEAYDQKYTHRAGLDASLQYTNDMFIGKDRNSTQFFKGSIDDIKIYDRPLSNTQIIDLYSRANWPLSKANYKISHNRPLIFCKGEKATLTVPSCVNSYVWSNSASGASIEISKSGKYWVRGFDNDGCQIMTDTVTVQIIPCDTPSNTLIAYYPFSENPADSSGNNLHGTVNGASLICDRFGNLAHAYSFDGNDFIQIPHNAKLTLGANPFSIVGWVKFCNELPDYSGIVAKGPTQIFYPGYQLTIANRNKITTQIGDSSGYGIERRGQSPLDDGKWHFLTLCVSNSSNLISEVKLYVDGKIESYNQVYTPRAGLDASLGYTTPLFIGKDRNSVRFFKGSIDDIRIYRGALSDSAVQALYHENGWPNAVPNLKIIPNGPTEFCEGQSVTLTAPQCIRSYQWSNGATTSSITVNTSGNYRLTGYDADGCIVAQDSVDVTVLSCGPDTATGDFTINIRSNCPGHTERMTIPFVNTYYSDTLTSVSFTGSSASAFSYNGALPTYLPPTTPVLLPITFRWVKPGSQKVVMTLSTSSGRQHRILLKTPVGNAITPFLNLSEVRVGPKSAAFDTCLTVTNLLDAGVTLKDTVWLGRGHSFKITAPALPFYIGPKGSAQLCFRIEPLAATAMDTVFIAAENAPNNCLACFYQPIEVSTRPPRPMISSAEDEPVTGNGRLKMAAFPNPNMGEMTLLLQASHTLTGTILVVDEHGRTVIEMPNQKIYSGNNLILIGSPTLSSGRYSIVLQSGAMRLVEAITVQQ